MPTSERIQSDFGWEGSGAFYGPPLSLSLAPSLCLPSSSLERSRGWQQVVGSAGPEAERKAPESRRPIDLARWRQALEAGAQLATGSKPLNCPGPRGAGGPLVGRRGRPEDLLPPDCATGAPPAGTRSGPSDNLISFTQMAPGE